MTQHLPDDSRPDDSLAETLAAAVPALRSHYAAQIEGIKLQARRRHVRRRLWAGGAAVAGCVLATIAVFGHYEVSAPPGRPLTVALGDGSTLALDAGASASLPILPWRRSVRLDRGEALFDILHDESRPFVVEAGPLTLTDRGTRFLVNTQSLSVTVFDGVVDVDMVGSPPVRLTAGQAAAAHGRDVSSALFTDEAVTTAWRQGRIVLRDATLAEAVARLSRYRAQPVELASVAMSGWKVSGSFRIDDTDGALATLERALPLVVRHEPARTVLVPRSPSSTPPERKK
jgi:transmembrane sensor